MRPYHSDEDDDSSMSSAFSDDEDKKSPQPFFAKLVRDTRSKVEQKKSELNATVQEKLPEWKKQGQIYSNRAKETGMEWSRRGKEAVDRWKREKAAESSPTSSSSRQVNNENAVFGMPLEVAVALTRIDQDDLTPAVFRRCIEYLDEYGIQEVGIYRIPGSTITVNKLRAVFNEGCDIDFNITKPDPHAVGTLLKMYLRELPEPIVPFELANEYTEQFINSIQSCSDTTKREAMRDTITSSTSNSTVQLPPTPPSLLKTVRSITARLPVYNLCLLQSLCRHLQRVANAEQQNRMSISNLAVIFIPTLNIGRALFHCMVENYVEIFERSAGPHLPPPLPQKPKKLVLDPAKKIPPPKPSRSPLPPQKKVQHARQKSEHSSRKKPPPPPVKPRSKSISSFRNEGRVEAIGRQFENLMNNGGLKNSSNKSPSDC
ncbi:RhoGAP-domain-containing protein [Backusella circina FSU 941]|nr:RhoGAP-domain-containing protein [Backusella circina FSU 941]